MNKESCKCLTPQDQSNGTGRCVYCNGEIDTFLKVEKKYIIGSEEYFDHLNEQDSNLSIDD